MTVYRPIAISALFLFLFAVIGAGLVAFTFDSTAEKIAENERRALLKSLNELVPEQRYDNDIFSDVVYVRNSELLGTSAPVPVYRARKDGWPVAAVLALRRGVIPATLGTERIDPDLPACRVFHSVQIANLAQEERHRICRHGPAFQRHGARYRGPLHQIHTDGLGHTGNQVVEAGIEDLANYGEYSGGPTTGETKFYAETLFDLMTREKDAQGRDKILIIGGAIANFTDVAKTFTGITMALRDYKKKLKDAKVVIYVRRGGPNYQEGLKIMKDLGEELGVPIDVYGPETHMTRIVDMALGGK